MNTYVSLKFSKRYILTIYTKDDTNDPQEVRAHIMDTSVSVVEGEFTFKVPTSRSKIKNITCLIADEEKRLFTCVFIENDSKINEFNLTFSTTQLSIKVLNNTFYHNYRYLPGSTVSLSSNYLVTVGEDFLTKDRRIFLYKRRKAGGSPYVYYSLNAEELYTGSNINDLSIFLFNKGGVDKLGVQNVRTMGMGRIYLLENARLNFTKMSFYDMKKMRAVFLDFYGGARMQRMPVYDLFFWNQNRTKYAGSKSLDDLGWTSWIFGFSLGGLFFFCVCCWACLVACYCCRRETLKEHGANF